MNKLELITFTTNMEEFETDLYNKLVDLVPDTSEEAEEKDYENDLDMIIEESRFEVTTKSFDWINEYNFIVERTVNEIRERMKDTYEDIKYSLSYYEETGDMQFVITVAFLKY